MASSDDRRILRNRITHCVVRESTGKCSVCDANYTDIPCHNQSPPTQDESSQRPAAPHLLIFSEPDAIVLKWIQNEKGGFNIQKYRIYTRTEETNPWQLLCEVKAKNTMPTMTHKITNVVEGKRFFAISAVDENQCESSFQGGFVVWAGNKKKH